MYSHILKRQSIASDDTLTGYPVDNLCQSCGHLNREQPTTCAAFPKGIPVGIIMGVIDHTQTYHHGKVDDGGLTYVPMDSDEPQQGEIFL